MGRHSHTHTNKKIMGCKPPERLRSCWSTWQHIDAMQKHLGHNISHLAVMDNDTQQTCNGKNCLCVDICWCICIYTYYYLCAGVCETSDNQCEERSQESIQILLIRPADCTSEFLQFYGCEGSLFVGFLLLCLVLFLFC